VEDRDRIHSEIDFFGRPDEHGPAVAAWLRSVNLAMFEPMVNRLQRAIGPPVEIEPHDFYREGTWYVQLSTATLRGSLSFYRYSPENLQKVIRKLGDGRLARVRLSVLDMMGGPGEAETLNVEVWFDSVEFPDWANSVLVQGPTSWIERFMGRVERPVVDLAKLAARELRAATGYVTLGGGSKVESSYEKAAGVGFADGLRFARENVRGAYWGTVLSKWHVEALGGVERIQSTAPCAVVEVLASAPSPLLWLQATIDFASFGHPQQVALRDYLGPVLPKRRPLPTGARPELGSVPVEAPVRPTRSTVGAGEPPARRALEVQHIGEYGPEVPFTLRFSRPPTDLEREALESTVLEWYDEWSAPDMEGVSFMSEVDFDEDDDDEGSTAKWWIDFGAAPEGALTDLLSRLDRAAIGGLPVAGLTLGSRLIG